MVISLVFFFFKQKTAYEIKECDWSSDVCSSDLNKEEEIQFQLGRRLVRFEREIHSGGTSAQGSGDEELATDSHRFPRNYEQFSVFLL